MFQVSFLADSTWLGLVFPSKLMILSFNAMVRLFSFKIIDLVGFMSAIVVLLFYSFLTLCCIGFLLLL